MPEMFLRLEVLTGITTRLLFRQLRGDFCLYVVLAKIGTTTLVVLWIGDVGLLVPDVSWLLQHSANSVLDFGNNWSSSQRRLHLFEHVGVNVFFLVVATVPEVALDMSGCLQHSWFDSGYMFTGAVLGQGCGHARCCAQDIAEACGDSTGAVLGQGCGHARCAQDIAEARGDSTGAVLGQGCGHTCCCAQDTAEARGDSTGAVLGQGCRARFAQRHGSDSAKSVWRGGDQHF